MSVAAPDRMTVDPGEKLLRCTDRGAVFGLILRDDRVIRAAPMGRWLMGKSEATVRALLAERNIKID